MRSVEEGCPYCGNMPKKSCVMNRNHAFQVDYFSLYSLWRVSWNIAILFFVHFNIVGHFLLPTSKGWGKVIVSVWLSVHTQGSTAVLARTGVPLYWEWDGVPPPLARTRVAPYLGWGTPQVQTGIPPAGMRYTTWLGWVPLPLQG